MSKFQKYTKFNITVSADKLTEGYLTTKLFDNTTENSKKVFLAYKQLMEILQEHQMLIKCIH